MTQKVTRRTIGEMSNDARILANFLSRELIDEAKEFVAYGDLSAAIGGSDVRGRYNYLLRTARRAVEREHHILTECVRGEGIKRTTAVAAMLAATKSHVGRTARRSIKRAAGVMAAAEIPNNERVAACVEISCLGAIELFTRRRARLQIEGKIAAEKPQELATTETLRLFANGHAKDE